MKYLMVLNDGETFTELDGCYVISVPDDWDKDTVKDIPSDIAPIYFHPKGMYLSEPANMKYTYDGITVSLL